MFFWDRLILTENERVKEEKYFGMRQKDNFFNFEKDT